MNEKTNIIVDEITTVDSTPFTLGSDIKKGRVLLNLYEVEEGPFKGSMGQVFRVHHKDWDVDLAMKQSILEGEELKELFKKECETWINLGLHPHIVSCYYVRNIEGTLSIFSEWMDGGNLKDYISEGKGALYQGKPIEILERILDIAIQMARGLDYAHQQDDKLIHRDIKPGNILLSKDGSVKIGDFGISKTKEMAYTLAYRSPEQATSNSQLTQKTDVWSWAATVLEMFIGKRPEEWRDGSKLGDEWQRYAKTPQVEIPQQMKMFLGDCVEENPFLRPDLKEIENRLVCLYKDITVNSYFRIKSQVVGNSADNLNNKALSFLDMGMPDDAETSWKQALNMGSNHQETVYNYSIYQWRNGKIDDRKVIEQIELAEHKNVIVSHPLLKMIDRERGISPENKILEILSLENITAYAIWQNYLLVTQTYNKETSPKTREERENWDPCVRLVQIWNIDNGALIKEIPHKGGIIKKIVASPNKSTVYLVDNFRIFCWQDFMDTTSTSTLEEINTPYPENVMKRYTHTNFCISSDGRYFFSTERNSIFRWDLIKNSYRSMILPEYCNVKFMCCSQSERLFTIDSDDILRIWNIHSGKSIGRMELESTVLSFDFCEEKNIMVINSYEGIFLLDMLSYKPLKKIKLSRNIEVDSICFIRNGDLLVIGQGRDIKIWDIENGRCLLTLKDDGYFIIRSIEAYGNNRIVSIGGIGESYDLKVWGIPCFDSYKAPWMLCQITSSHEKIKQEARIRQLFDEIQYLMEKGDVLAAHKLFLSLDNIPGSAFFAGFVELQQLILRYCRTVGLNACWKERQYTFTYDDESNYSNISSNAQYVIAGGEMGSLQLWHTLSGKTKCLQGTDRFSIRQLQFMKGNKQLLFSEWTPWIRRWDCETGEKVKEYVPDRHANLVHFCLSSDERFLLAGGTGGIVFLLDVETGECLETFKGNSSKVEDLCFSPDEQFFCVAYGDYCSSNDENIQIWDLNEKKCVGGFKTSRHPIALCNYGKTMICLAGWDNRIIELKNLQSWEIVCKLKGHEAKVCSLSVSKDEKFLLSGDDSGIIRLWDLHTGICLKEIETEYNNSVYDIHFSDDGSSFIYNVGGKVYLWRLAWDLDFPGWANWDDNVFPYIKNFFIAYPKWTETDFERLISELQYKGYGWIKPDGVRAKLIKLSTQTPMISDFYRKKSDWEMPTVNKIILKTVKDSVEEVFNNLYDIHRPLLLGSGYSTSALSETYGIHDVAIDSANAAYDAACKVVNDAFPDVDVFDWIKNSPQYKQAKEQATNAARTAALEVINEARRQERLFLRDGTRSATILLACDYARSRK